MVSIIILTYNASDYLPAQAAELESQTIRDFELIVMDSSSDDNTVEIARSCGAKIISIARSDFDHGATRTLAAQEAKGNVLVYLSQDVLPKDEHTIARLIKPLATDSQIAMVYGRQLPLPNATPFAAHLRCFNYGPASYGRRLEDKSRFGLETIFFSNGFAAYRKSDLEEVGYFPSGIIFGEDTLTAAKILLRGKKLFYTADAEVFHSHNYSAVQEFKRYFDVGVFHRDHDWLLKQFGNPGGCGWEYVKSEICYLGRGQQHRLYLECILRNGLKFMGYRLGRRYRYLPEFIRPCLSMNKNWWKRKRQ